MRPRFDDEQQISGRLKNALLADLVMRDPSAESDAFLAEPMNYPHQWTEHLGRQIGFDDTDRHGIHETLLFILRQLDELMRQWPPLRDAETCRSLAHEAAKHLGSVEVYGTLLEGPPAWASHKVDGGRVDKMRAQLLPILERGLAAELGRILDQWVEWDVRKLRDRRDEAIKAKRHAEIDEARQRAAREGPPSGRRRSGDRPPPPFEPPPRDFMPPRITRGSQAPPESPSSDSTTNG